MALLRGRERGRGRGFRLRWLAPKYVWLRMRGNEKAGELIGLGNGRDLVVIYETTLAEEVER